MEKKFSKIEIHTIKTIAKNVAPYVAKKQKIDAQIKEVEEKVAEQIRKRVEEKVAKLNAEKAGYQSVIDSMNATVKTITGGYTTEDLVDVVKEGTGKFDEKGREIMATRYNLKYPETVIPAVEMPEAGNDFDADAEKAAVEGAEDIPEEVIAEQAETQIAAEQTDPFAEGWV